MPTSLLAQWDTILRYIKEAPRPAGWVLDVGPGHGKAPTLLEEYVPSVEGVDALEACPEYVERFQLERKYGLVAVGRFEDQKEQFFDAYDTVLMVDVIEHMGKPWALAALDRVRGQVVICTPVHFAEAWEPGMPETEHHVSLWTPADFGPRLEACYEINDGWIIRLAPRST